MLALLAILICCVGIALVFASDEVYPRNMSATVFIGGLAVFVGGFIVLVSTL